MRNEIEFLVDGTDAQRLRVLRVLDLYFLTVKKDFSCAFLISAAQNLHERGLARTILAEKDMNLASSQIEINVVQSHDARKRLPDMTHLQNGGICHLARPFLAKR